MNKPQFSFEELKRRLAQAVGSGNERGFAAEPSAKKPVAKFFAGLKVMVENPKGSTRSGVDRRGKKWKTVMKNDYGYFARTRGADGEGVDVFIGPETNPTEVYVIHTQDPYTSVYDEDKVVLGAKSAKQAREIFNANYDSDRHYRSMTMIPFSRFKKMLSAGEPGGIRWCRKNRRCHAEAAMFAADGAHGFDAVTTGYSPKGNVTMAGGRNPTSSVATTGPQSGPGSPGWDERKHPRDHGKFAPKEGENGSAGGGSSGPHEHVASEKSDDVAPKQVAPPHVAANPESPLFDVKANPAAAAAKPKSISEQKKYNPMLDNTTGGVLGQDGTSLAEVGEEHPRHHSLEEWHNLPQNQGKHPEESESLYWQGIDRTANHNAAAPADKQIHVPERTIKSWPQEKQDAYHKRIAAGAFDRAAEERNKEEQQKAVATQQQPQAPTHAEATQADAQQNSRPTYQQQVQGHVAAIEADKARQQEPQQAAPVASPPASQAPDNQQESIESRANKLGVTTKGGRSQTPPVASQAGVKPPPQVNRGGDVEGPSVAAKGDPSAVMTAGQTSNDEIQKRRLEEANRANQQYEESKPGAQKSLPYDQPPKKPEPQPERKPNRPGVDPFTQAAQIKAGKSQPRDPEQGAAVDAPTQNSPVDQLRDKMALNAEHQKKLDDTKVGDTVFDGRGEFRTVHGKTDGKIKIHDGFKEVELSPDQYHLSTPQNPYGVTEMDASEKNRRAEESMLRHRIPNLHREAIQQALPTGRFGLDRESNRHHMMNSIAEASYEAERMGYTLHNWQYDPRTQRYVADIKRDGKPVSNLEVPENPPPQATRMGVSAPAAKRSVDHNSAADVVMKHGRANEILLQRELNIGHEEASRLMREMEQSGVVGPYNAVKGREIKMSPEQWEAKKRGLSMGNTHADKADGAAINPTGADNERARNEQRDAAKLESVNRQQQLEQQRREAAVQSGGGGPSPASPENGAGPSGQGGFRDSRVEPLIHSLSDASGGKATRQSDGTWIVNRNSGPVEVHTTSDIPMHPDAYAASLVAGYGGKVIQTGEGQTYTIPTDEKKVAETIRRADAGDADAIAEKARMMSVASPVALYENRGPGRPPRVYVSPEARAEHLLEEFAHNSIHSEVSPIDRQTLVNALRPINYNADGSSYQGSYEEAEEHLVRMIAGDGTRGEGARDAFDNWENTPGLKEAYQRAWDSVHKQSSSDGTRGHIHHLQQINGGKDVPDASPGVRRYALWPKPGKPEKPSIGDPSFSDEIGEYLHGVPETEGGRAATGKVVADILAKQYGKQWSRLDEKEKAEAVKSAAKSLKDYAAKANKKELLIPGVEQPEGTPIAEHGTQVELPLHKAFLDNPSPSSEQLASIEGSMHPRRGPIMHAFAKLTPSEKATFMKAEKIDASLPNATDIASRQWTMKVVDALKSNGARIGKDFSVSPDGHSVSINGEYLDKDVRQPSYEELKSRAKEALRIMRDPSWYQKVPQYARELVGDKNMPEFGAVLAITSPKKGFEINMSEALTIMKSVRGLHDQTNGNFSYEQFEKAIRDARRPGYTARQRFVIAENKKRVEQGRKPVPVPDAPKIAVTGPQIKDLYNFYTTGNRPSQYKTSIFGVHTGAGDEPGFYSPWTVQDVQMNKFFGDQSKNISRTTGELVQGAENAESDKQYRFNNYLTLKLANEFGVTPQQMQSAAWLWGKLKDSSKADDTFAHMAEHDENNSPIQEQVEVTDPETGKAKMMNRWKPDASLEEKGIQPGTPQSWKLMAERSGEIGDYRSIKDHPYQWKENEGITAGGKGENPAYSRKRDLELRQEAMKHARTALMGTDADPNAWEAPKEKAGDVNFAAELRGKIKSAITDPDGQIRFLKKIGIPHVVEEGRGSYGGHEGNLQIRIPSTAVGASNMAHFVGALYGKYGHQAAYIVSHPQYNSPNIQGLAIGNKDGKPLTPQEIERIHAAMNPNKELYGDNYSLSPDGSSMVYLHFHPDWKPVGSPEFNETFGNWAEGVHKKLADNNLSEYTPVLSQGSTDYVESGDYGHELARHANDPAIPESARQGLNGVAEGKIGGSGHTSSPRRSLDIQRWAIGDLFEPTAKTYLENGYAFDLKTYADRRKIPESDVKNLLEPAISKYAAQRPDGKWVAKPQPPQGGQPAVAPTPQPTPAPKPVTPIDELKAKMAAKAAQKPAKTASGSPAASPPPKTPPAKKKPASGPAKGGGGARSVEPEVAPAPGSAEQGAHKSTPRETMFDGRPADDVIHGAQIRYMGKSPDYEEDEEAASAYGDAYFGIGHGDFNEDGNYEPDTRNVVYYVDQKNGQVQHSIFDKGENPGTHGTEFTHEVANTGFKGRYELDTGRLTISPPSDRYNKPVSDKAIKSIISQFNQMAEDEGGKPVSEVRVFAPKPKYLQSGGFGRDLSGITKRSEPGQHFEGASKDVVDLHAKILAMADGGEHKAARDAERELAVWQQANEGAFDVDPEEPMAERMRKVQLADEKAKEFKKRYGRIEELKKAAHGKAMATLANPHGPGKIVLRVSPRLLQRSGSNGFDASPSVKEGVDAINRLMPGTSLDKHPPTIIPMPQHYRENYSPDWHTISMSSSAHPSVVAHELGHAIECSDRRIFDECVAFREKRRGGEEWRPLKEITGNPSHDEDHSFEDNWINPYSGKKYEAENELKSTEVLSTGIEHLVKDPVKFAHEDPEHFQFTMHILRKYGAQEAAKPSLTDKIGQHFVQTPMRTMIPLGKVYPEAADHVHDYLKVNDYINDDGLITDKYHKDKQAGNLYPIDRMSYSLKPYAKSIHDLISSLPREQGRGSGKLSSSPREPWEMTRKEWNDYHFNEDRDRHLPADYFSEHQFNGRIESTKPIKTLENGIELRVDKYNIVYAFDGEKNVGMGDGKAFVVAPEYQKMGIGKALMQETLTGRPIGSRTNAGSALINSFHRSSVEKALSEGKQVPESVLAEYPELARKEVQQ